jgi:hypothetical protein
MTSIRTLSLAALVALVLGAVSPPAHAEGPRADLVQTVKGDVAKIRAFVQQQHALAKSLGVGSAAPGRVMVPLFAGAMSQSGTVIIVTEFSDIEALSKTIRTVGASPQGRELWAGIPFEVINRMVAVEAAE